ncbi:ABC-type transport system involved in Fe-S cluster assembly, permease component [Marinitoga piezophila KA3]|uniref:ABC-type transport system involved in Fe-S cluster assembly, permease component n=1 Tax=Marinitoga piezophila (strain DSM 14283 / JCM 11233 / KA3) TaxID=443254 RepID=H2J313_MARPK|nr:MULTISPECIES: SufD family Fe-S cluster assembly protein [Marinitoga]AEX85704.1 ABC-type transport system involved in Fe-S cluster assembly, permease component [Marinitoga piezophila KA3]APT76156.1 hypothetical protein LN42_06990 [Marinitoga sp. 1137]
MYEKALVLNHNDFLATEWKVPEIKSDNDYGIIEIEEAEKFYTSNELKSFRRKRFEEYKTLGFPKWKRSKLEGFNPLPYVAKFNSLMSDNLKSINDIDNKGIEILNNMDFDGSHRKFLLMSDVFFNTGFYLKTNKNQNNEVYWIKEVIDKSPLYGLEVIYIDENSEATLIRFIESKGKGTKIKTLRGKLEENSKLTVININLFDNDISTDNMFFDVGKNAQLTVYDINIGGKVTAPHIVTRLANENGKVDIYPYYLTQDNEIIDMFYLLRYYAPETIGHIVGRGVLMDSSRVIFRGNLDIKKGAKNAEAEEQDFNLVLSEKAKVMAFPSLYVDENEVNAGHAASVGTIEEDKLYYMMTRGYSKNAAKKEIAFGNFEPAIEVIEEINSKYAGALRDVIERRFDKEFSNS